MRIVLSLGLALAALSGCPRAKEVPVAPPRALEAPQWWVDASQPPGGDGSRQRPFRELQSALDAPPAGPRLIHLASGLYAGPLSLGDGVTLRGTGRTVLQAGGEVPEVLRVSGQVQLERLLVSGGQTGIVGTGKLALSEVGLSAYRKVGIHHQGVVQLRSGEIQGTVSETVGVHVPKGARLEAVGVRFRGALRRAIEVHGGEAQVSEATFFGPVTGFHQRGGKAALQHCSFSEGRGPAIFVAGGELALSRTRVNGHEYGLQSGMGAVLWVSDFVSTKPERAGLGLVGTKGVLRDLVVLDTGSYGGIQLTSSEVVLERVRIHRAQAFGVFSRQGRVHLKDALITQVAGEGQGSGRTGGDGVQLYGGIHVLEDVRVMEADGSGLLSSMHAELTVTELLCERCAWGGVVAEQLSKVDAASIVVRRSLVGVAVPDEARLRVGVLVSEHNQEGPFWVECGAGGALALGALRSDVQARTSPCVSRWESPALPKAGLPTTESPAP